MVAGSLPPAHLLPMGFGLSMVGEAGAQGRLLKPAGGEAVQSRNQGQKPVPSKAGEFCVFPASGIWEVVGVA